LVKAINSDVSVREVIPFNAGDISVRDFAPRSDWSEMGESDHFVQFYEADAFLLNSLGGYIGGGLVEGDGCVVVASKAIREGLDARLQARGFDVDAAVERGQYVSLDAAETLSKFMVDGSPEFGRFAEVIEGVLARASQGRRRMRVFGEMVALLCGEGRHAAAISLEGLWNDLQKTRSFSLFCAYPMNIFGGDALSASLADVCAGHSRVIPAESYTELADADERLRIITKLQHKARSLEAEIAERKEAEERLRVSLRERERLLVREQLARAEAESANRMKDEFLATVSHELRTPLTAIMGWSHMLRSGKLDEATAARALDTIERNAQAQAQLVEDILDVSRVITGNLRLNSTEVDVASVINAAIDSVQLAADSKGIRLEVTLEASARHVAGDATRLQQVVWNLLANAIKFTPSGGRVAVRLERAGADAQLSVSDTGQGISRDFLPFIFDRFRQEDATTTRRHGGLGLGLAIVRHLVELHGGTVRADSAGEERGTTFIIKLPLAKA
jgi:signal transduction histidine kinase